jgi:hypothetical protein
MAYAIPKYISAEEYSKQSNLGVEEVKRLCRIGEIKCKMTEGGHYKIPLYDDAVPKEEYEKLMKENSRLRTIVQMIAVTANQM